MSKQDIATIPEQESGGFGLVAVKQLDEELKKALKDTVAPNVTDTQLAYFLTVAKAQGLNPWMHEVWCIPMGGRLVIMTSSDGYQKIAKRDPQFDSIQSAEVCEGDHFLIDPVTGDVEHRINPAKRGEILGAYAIITRKDKRRFAKYVSIKEYRGQSEPWRKYTSAMIQKVAKTALCKEWANITGVMAEEIMPTDAINAEASPQAQQTSSQLKDDLLAKIAACKTMQEFDELKQTLPPLFGKLMEAEKKAVTEAATAKKKELAVIDVETEKKEPEEAVSSQDDEDDGVAADMTDPLEDEPKVNLEDVIAAIRETDTMKELIDFWMFKVTKMELTPDELAQAKEVYERRKELFAGEETPPTKKTRKAA